MTDAPRVVRHDFADLACPRQHTAAGRGVPLVMWTDTIDGAEQLQRNHHSDFCSLYVVKRGRGTHVIDGQAFGVARGDVYAMAPGMTHYFADCHDLQTDTFHFAPALFDDEIRAALGTLPGFHALFVGASVPNPAQDAPLGGRWLHLTPPAHADVCVAVDELRAEWTRGDATGTLLCRGLFFRLLVKLARAYSPVAAHNGAQEATVAAALRFMEARFAEPLRVEEVARAVFLSPDRFTEVFAQGMGRTPRDYLRYLRVEKAKALLSAGHLSITGVAQQSGFGDPAYFARAFRAATDTSPSEWRKRYGVGGAV